MSLRRRLWLLQHRTLPVRHTVAYSGLCEKARMPSTHRIGQMIVLVVYRESDWSPPFEERISEYGETTAAEEKVEDRGWYR